ncbi:phage tail protein, partial [Escherichia coli]|nr:phage tail protein [Escherichia coli]
ATDYPVLAKVFPSLVLPEARGDFIRIWDDGRGVDSGRGLLSTQSDLMKQFTLQYYGPSAGTGTRTVFALQSNANGIYTSGIGQNDGSVTAAAFNVPGGTETRPRNIAFNFLVRAK